MSALTSSPVFLLALTLAAYAGAEALYQRVRRPWFNPVLIAVAVLVAALRVLRIEYASYASGTSALSVFLGPAVVALGVTVHEQWATLRARGGALLLALGAGSVVGVASAVLLGRALGASREVTATLATKSVTTPIAMAIAERVGGVPALAAALVVLVGVFGAVVGPAWLTLLGVRSPAARGLAMGAAAHVVGTARALEDGAVPGATAATAIALHGLATALAAPVLLAWLAP